MAYRNYYTLTIGTIGPLSYNTLRGDFMYIRKATEPDVHYFLWHLSADDVNE
ncbi:internal (core) protein [Enterobacter phage 02_vB_Eclo_IJM]|nr:internal (core) protein [Enterobacter phage 02_vB_Eclo_IJM]